jgi:hypothetical protein
MKSIPVTSRIIESVHFSAADGQLRIRFKNGEVRRFSDVPLTAVVAMCEADSPGQHYIDHIRMNFSRVAA